MQERFTSKNMKTIRAPTDCLPGIGEFEFIDNYSIFHLGKMPDQIPAKGEATCRIAVENFRLFNEAGIPSHFIGRIDSTKIQFHLLRILDPAKRQIDRGERAYFVPLQVIFRNHLPREASIFRRLASGEISPGDLGLSEAPKPGGRLDRPIIEYMSKLDEIDEFISRGDAQHLAGLSDGQMNELDELVRRVNDVLYAKARSVGLTLADAKVEFGVDGMGGLLLVDVAGTPDESRFLLDGRHVSKQVLRDCYAGTGLRQQVREWAARGRPHDEKPSPPPLRDTQVQLVSEMYKSLCERWLQNSLWGAASLETLLVQLSALSVCAPTK